MGRRRRGGSYQVAGESPCANGIKVSSMDLPQFALADDQAATDDAGRLLERAMAHSIMLRRAFGMALSRRHDAAEWELLERETGRILEQNGLRRDVDWFIDADERLTDSVTKLFKNRSSKSRRPVHFRRAASQVYESAALWGKNLDEKSGTYWRHSALVWMTLWHLADVADVTASQARKCLLHCFEGTASSIEPPPELPQQERAHNRLSTAVAFLADAFRKKT